MEVKLISDVYEAEVKRILSSIEHLHSSMGILSKLYQMLTSDSADLQEAERLILSDTNLTGAVIRLSNSAAYGRVVRSTDLHSSVVMVGFRQILQLVGACLSKRLFLHQLPYYGINGYEFWDESFLTALVMERFAFPLISPTDDAYLLGLMHSVGKLVVEECLTHYPLVCSHAADPDMPPFSAEMELEIFGCRHTELGAQLLERWRFPRSVVLALRRRFEAQSLNGNPLVCLLDWATALRKANDGDKRQGDWDLLPDHPFRRLCDLEPQAMQREISTARQTFYIVRESIIDGGNPPQNFTAECR